MIGKEFSHYRILAKLGEGGMGEVYLAEDRILKRKVALKFVAAERQKSEAARRRFQREAQAVAALNHPFICSIFEFGQFKGRDFFCMEYVEGQTLQERIERGPLKPRKALQLAREIAEALHRAHEKGIAHRDLKPGNVMITADGHAKLMDFGLASWFQTTGEDQPQSDRPTALTAEGSTLGTLIYMAPEQIRGLTADQRSDIFSFGMILYEMLSGSHPFHRLAQLETVSAILSSETPELPDDLGEIKHSIQPFLNRMTAKDPEDRYQSAGDIARHLDDLSLVGVDGALTGESVTIRRPASRSWVWKRPALMVVAILAGAVLIAYFMMDSKPQTAPDHPVKRVRIVLGPFQDHTGEPLLEHSLKAAFRVALEQSRSLYLIPESEIRRALQRMRLAPDSVVDRELGVDLCLREAAEALVLPSASRVGQTYLIGAQVVNCVVAETIFSHQARSQGLDAVLGGLDEVALKIRRYLGDELPAGAAPRPLEKLTTGNLEALRAYSLANKELAEGERDNAIALLQRAIELDPEFAMAHAKLGAIYRSFDRDWGQALTHFRQALASSDRLTEREKLYIQGWMALAEGTPEEMVRIWSLFGTLYPEELVGHFNLAMVRWIFENDYQEAVNSLERAASIAEPVRYFAIDALGFCLLALGRSEEALESFRQAWELSGDPLESGLADGLVVLGRYDEAEEFLEEAGSHPEGYQRLRARLSLISAHIDRGDFARAEKLARDTVALAGQLQRYRLETSARAALIAVLQQQPQTERLNVELEGAVSSALALLDRDAIPDIVLFPYLSLLGKSATRAGNQELGSAVLARIKPFASERQSALLHAYAGMLEGELLLSQGMQAEAVSRLERALGETGLFQLHESLARAYEVGGQLESAAEHYQWLVNNRGLAFVECMMDCSGRDFSVAAWSVALFRLAEIYEKLGEAQLALEYYQRFADQWRRAAADNPLLQTAREKLADHGPRDSTARSSDHVCEEDGCLCAELLFRRQGNLLGQVLGLDMNPVFGQNADRIFHQPVAKYVIRA